MNLKEKIKKTIILSALKKRIKQHPFNPEEAEKHQLSGDNNPFETNSYYFTGHNNDGNSFYCRYAIRGSGMVEIWFFFQTKDEIYYNEVDIFPIEKSPIQLECLKIASTWKLTFQGELIKGTLENTQVQNSGRKVKCKADLNFQATSNIFDFEHDVNPEILAKRLAKEKWDKNFRYNNKISKQTHYEQQGLVQLVINIDDHISTISFLAMRDHSFGRRDWNYMNNHIWLMALVKNNVSLNINMVNYPHMKLITGYYEDNHQVISITSSSDFFKFNGHGACLKQFAYYVKLADGRKLEVSVNLESQIKWMFYNSYYICEGIGTYVIDGVSCRGIVEFGFNVNTARWESNNENI
ncbi:MAG: hypothetical protein LBV55_02830 [Acholeplasmatales bacterium]|jgi:hypothetical protein|nr:hypothetical protein [Acholeplasmatales bacterium]